MTDWWKVSFSSLHANASIGMLPGKRKNQSTWILTFLQLFFLMVYFIFVTTEHQLGYSLLLQA